jgi:hypothetical protein
LPIASVLFSLRSPGQRIHGNDQEPEAGGALIDVQTFLSQTGTTHICLFHSPKETGPVGINAIRGHGSAGGAVSGCISLHYLEKKDPQTGRIVADKMNPHRRMVYEGRGPFIDLLIRGDWPEGLFEVIGPFEEKLGRLLADQNKQAAIAKLTKGQTETLTAIPTAVRASGESGGATVQQVAQAKVGKDDRMPTSSEIESTRKQLSSLAKNGLLKSTTQNGPIRYALKG